MTPPLNGSNVGTNLRYSWTQSVNVHIVHSDLEVVLTDNHWDSTLELIHTSPTSAKHRLLQLKVVHRAHFTNARPAKIYLTVDPLALDAWASQWTGMGFLPC